MTHLQAAAMRQRAADAMYPMLRSMISRTAAAETILALPLEATDAELLAEAVKVLCANITAQHKRVMSGEQRFYAKNITNACCEMGDPIGNAVERLIAALKALETP